MKPLTAPTRVTLPSSLGHDQTTTRQAFRLEPEDVGTTRENYLGFKHRDYKFAWNDKGRIIEVITAPGYTCWCFCGGIPLYLQAYGEPHVD